MFRKEHRLECIVLTIYLVSAVLFCNGQYVYNILKANL